MAVLGRFRRFVRMLDWLYPLTMELVSAILLGPGIVSFMKVFGKLTTGEDLGTLRLGDTGIADR